MTRLAPAAMCLLAAACGESWKAPEAGLVLTPTGSFTTEGGGMATVEVSLAMKPTGLVTVDVLSGDSTEGAILDVETGEPTAWTTLRFGPSDWGAPQSVTVVGVDDDARDGDVAWSVIVAVAASADAGYAGLDAAHATFTNRDDDTPAIRLSRTEVLTWEQLQTTGAFTVALAARPASTVIVPVASGRPEEGRLRSSTSPTVADPRLDLVFTPSDWSTPREVIVVGQDDFLVDGDQTYWITVGPATGDAEYAALPAQEVRVRNRDAADLLTLPGERTLAEGSVDSLCIGTPWDAPTAEVAIELESLDRTVAQVSVVGASGPFSPSATLRLPAGAPYECFWVEAVRDFGLEPRRTTSIRIGPTQSADARFDGQPERTVGVVALNTDYAGLLMDYAAPLITGESGATDAISVALQSRPRSDVTVPVEVWDPAEGLLSTGAGAPVAALALTFTPLDWNVPQTVTVHGVDDAIFEPGAPRYFAIRVGGLSSADPAWSLPGLITDLSAYNRDDDLAAPEGTLGSPLDVTGSLPWYGTVDDTVSFYEVTGLSGPSFVTFRSVASATLTITVADDGDFSGGVLCSLAISPGKYLDTCTAAAPASGRLVVRVESGIPGGAAYTLDVLPAPADCAVVIGAGTIQDATTTSDPIYGGSYSRSYCLALIDGWGVTLTTGPPTSGTPIYDTLLRLFDPAGVFLAWNDDTWATGAYSSIGPIGVATPGWHRVMVSGKGSYVGAYQLTVSWF